MRFEISKEEKGYIIGKPDGDFHVYVSKVYSGKYTWTRDYLHAKHFSEKTAEKHLEVLRRQQCELNGRTYLSKDQILGIAERQVKKAAKAYENNFNRPGATDREKENLVANKEYTRIVFELINACSLNQIYR